MLALKAPHNPRSLVTTATTMPTLLSFLEQRMRVSVHAPAQGANRIPHLVSVRAGGENAVLRALELGRSDHLHRFRDLLRFLDGIDLPPDGLEAWHTG